MVRFLKRPFTSVLICSIFLFLSGCVFVYDPFVFSSEQHNTTVLSLLPSSTTPIKVGDKIHFSYMYFPEKRDQITAGMPSWTVTGEIGTLIGTTFYAERRGKGYVIVAVDGYYDTCYIEVR